MVRFRKCLGVKTLPTVTASTSACIVAVTEDESPSVVKVVFVFHVPTICRRFDLLQKPEGSRKGYAEYHQIFDRETQAQSKREQKRCQQTVVTQIPWFHIFPNVWTVQDSDSCQKHEAVQG